MYVVVNSKGEFDLKNLLDKDLYLGWCFCIFLCVGEYKCFFLGKKCCIWCYDKFIYIQKKGNFYRFF